MLVICNVSISEPCLKVLLCPVCCPTSSAALFSSFTISAGELDTSNSNVCVMCLAFLILSYVDYSWLLPYIQSQFVLFPSHPWRKLVKGTWSQLRDPMEPLEGEIPYWEKVIWPSLFNLLSTVSLSGKLLERRNSGQRYHPAQNYPKADRSRCCCPMTCWLESHQSIKFWFNLGLQDENCFFFCWFKANDPCYHLGFYWWHIIIMRTHQAQSKVSWIFHDSPIFRILSPPYHQHPMFLNRFNTQKTNNLSWPMGLPIPRPSGMWKSGGAHTKVVNVLLFTSSVANCQVWLSHV